MQSAKAAVAADLPVGVGDVAVTGYRHVRICEASRTVIFVVVDGAGRSLNKDMSGFVSMQSINWGRQLGA
jgi:hypothetical protein